MIDWDKPLATTDGRKVTKIATLNYLINEVCHVLRVHNKEGSDCDILRSSYNHHVNVAGLSWGRDVVIINDVVEGKFYHPILNDGKYLSGVAYPSMKEVIEAFKHAGEGCPAVVEFTTVDEVITDVILIAKEKK